MYIETAKALPLRDHVFETDGSLRGCTIGRCIDRARMGENVGGVSVRMRLPTPMNRLDACVSGALQADGNIDLPKHATRCHHVFAQQPHNSSLTGAILKDGDSAWVEVSYGRRCYRNQLTINEAHYGTNRCYLSAANLNHPAHNVLPPISIPILTARC